MSRFAQVSSLKRYQLSKHCKWQNLPEYSEEVGVRYFGTNHLWWEAIYRRIAMEIWTLGAGNLCRQKLYTDTLFSICNSQRVLERCTSTSTERYNWRFEVGSSRRSPHRIRRVCHIFCVEADIVDSDCDIKTRVGMLLCFSHVFATAFLCG